MHRRTVHYPTSVSAQEASDAGESAPEQLPADGPPPGDRARDPLRRRLLPFVLLLGAGFALLIWRYGTIMVGSEQGPTVRLPEIERGPLLDRNGRILAISTQLDSVTAWLPDVSRPHQTAQALAEILEMEVDDVLARLHGSNNFVFVRRHVTPAQSALIKAARERGELHGIRLQPEQTRTYPGQELAAQVLGFVGVDNIGLEGIEHTFNHVLAPDTIPDDSTEVFGNKVFLTLDVNVQFEMERIAGAARTKHAADAVYIVVAAARTGEILAYASRPTFNPNDYAAVPATRWRNDMATTPYEPGSVLKVFTMASLLQAGAVSTSTWFSSPGQYIRRLTNGTVIRIRDLGVYGPVNVELILRYSSNAGAAYASDRIDADAFYGLLRQFGFGEPTGAPFRGESAGILRPVDEWSARSKPTIAIGQEISVTTLQMVQAATALANGGVLLRPQIVRTVEAADGTVVKSFAPEPSTAVLSPTVAGQILEMMETVTESGTAQLARLRNYRISAKTGTAQMIDPETRAYSQERLTASVLGILPTDDPAFIVYVVIHHPKGEQRYGGLIAAPLLREVASFLTTYYALPPTEQQPLQHPAHVVVPAAPRPTLGDVVPRLIGLPQRRLLPLLGNTGVRVELRGSGYVRRQDPAPGTPLTGDTRIRVWLD